MYTKEDLIIIARIHRETGKWAKLLKPTRLSTEIRKVAGFRPMPKLAAPMEYFTAALDKPAAKFLLEK